MIKIALAVNRVTDSFKENFRNILNYVHQAGEEGAELILFPEASITGLINNDHPAHDIKLGIEVPGRYTDLLCEQAKKSQINVALGLFEKEEGKLYDTAIFITRDGEIGLKYRRMSKGWHSPNGDSNFYVEGTEIGIFQSDIGKVCFLICGDFFDSKLVGKVRENDAKFLLFPFARAFDDRTADQKKWDEDELDDYINQVKRAGKTTLMTNYLGTSEIDDPSFGGAYVVTGEGQILGRMPLGKEGILYVNIN